VSPRARVQVQLALDEQRIDDPDLEGALEKRLRLSDDVSEARAVYRTADEEAKAAIATHRLDVGAVVRCGRFRITRTHTPPPQRVVRDRGQRSAPDLAHRRRLIAA
jgi:hypothetical protein